MCAASVGARNSHGLSLVLWCAGLGFLVGLLLPLLSSRIRARLLARPEQLLLSYALEPGTNEVNAVLGPRGYVCWTSSSPEGDLAQARAVPTAVSPSTIEVQFGSDAEGTPTPSSMVSFRITNDRFTRVTIRVVAKERCWLHGAVDR